MCAKNWTLSGLKKPNLEKDTIPVHSSGFEAREDLRTRALANCKNPPNWKPALGKTPD